MKKLYVLKVIFAILLFASCDKSVKEKELAKEENAVKELVLEPTIRLHAKDSLNWEGVYEGVLPCTNCPGIKTIIKLKNDLTYTVGQQYVGGVEQDSHGVFDWDEDGIIIHLKDVNKMEFLFRVEENQIRMLNSKGHAIKGENAEAYILKKM